MTMGDAAYRNSEGYHDPTAGAALRNMERETAAERLTEAVRQIRAVAAEYGFEIVGRIPLRDRASGREYR